MNALQLVVKQAAIRQFRAGSALKASGHEWEDFGGCNRVRSLVIGGCGRVTTGEPTDWQPSHCHARGCVLRETMIDPPFPSERPFSAKGVVYSENILRNRFTTGAIF